MSTSSALWLALGVCGALGCATETAELGQACTRTAQCAAGLACIEGECSSDLDAVGRQGSVPMLTPDAGADGAADAGADGAADTGADASDEGGAAGGGADASLGADAGADAAVVADDDAG